MIFSRALLNPMTLCRLRNMSYELSARDNVEELNGEYHIFCICDSDEPDEFCIDFVYDDEDSDEVTTVYFKDGKCDNWSYVH